MFGLAGVVQRDYAYLLPCVAFGTTFCLNILTLLFERESAKFQLALIAAYISLLAGLIDYLSFRGFVSARAHARLCGCVCVVVGGDVSEALGVPLCCIVSGQGTGLFLLLRMEPCSVPPFLYTNQPTMAATFTCRCRS